MKRVWLGRFQLRAAAVLCFALAVASVASAQAVATNGPVPAVPAPPAVVADPPDIYVSPTNGLGSWIWASNTFNGQICRLWKTFEIPPGSPITKARLVMTADNEFTLFLDGRELGHGAEWRELFVYDVARILTPGRHVLAVKAMNSFSIAGMLFGLRVDLADGRIVEVKSDRSWRIVPDDVRRWETRTEPVVGWRAATIIAPLGNALWWEHPVAINMIPSLQPVTVFFWQTGWFQIALLLVCGLVILFSLRLMAQLALHRKERWLLQRERARIAREIHDDIGARMTQLVLHGEVAQGGLADGSEAQVHLVQICEEARSLLSTMDEILWAVNPKRDTLRDFSAYVCNYAQKFLKPTSIQCLFELDPEMSTADFNLPLRRSLLMAIKETLNNAVKHSGATEVHLKIQWPGEHLLVVVQDNGQGFDPAILKTERNGLTNMSQRMAELGGTCQITSRPGQGCRVELSMPLKHPRRSLWAWFWQPKDFSSQTPDPRPRTQAPAQPHDPTQ